MVSRRWGGSKPGHIHLCIDCMWLLENAAGDAIVAEVEKIRGHDDE
jgi:Zn-finger protein